jgi:hypothetical protein
MPYARIFETPHIPQWLQRRLNARIPSSVLHKPVGSASLPFADLGADDFRFALQRQRHDSGRSVVSVGSDLKSELPTHPEHHGILLQHLAANRL